MVSPSQSTPEPEAHILSAGPQTQSGSLYHALRLEERIAAVTAVLGQVTEFRMTVIRRFVVRVGGWRPETLRSWPAARLAREAVKRNLEEPADEELLLMAYYGSVRPEIQTAFLEATGVPHEGAMIAEDAPRPLASSAVVVPAAIALHEQFGESALHYIQCLRRYAHKNWEGLDEAITAVEEATAPAGVATQCDQERAPSSAPAVVAEPRNDDTYPSRMALPGKGELHVLDDVVTLAVINAVKGIDAAPTIEEARRLVAEFVRVNGQRHQSWYAAGLYRALAGDDGVVPGPGEAPGARRWFLAGQVVGFRRRGDGQAILDLFDQDAECRELGDDGEGPSHQAAPHVFAALWEEGRFEDAVAFASPYAAARARPLFQEIFRCASDLLAHRDWDHARPGFDLLGEALALLRQYGDPSLESIRPVIERRQAHCRRLAGEFQAAMEILRPMVLDESIEPEVRGMMLVDLGLMDAGYTELSRLVLPPERIEADQISRRLDGIQEFLDQAISLDPDGAAHARYVLGFQALLHENGAAARVQLERALTAFRAKPEVYARQGVLERAQLYHALATCLDHEQSPARVQAAADQIIASTVEELKIPGWMLESVLTGITMADQQRAIDLAARLLELRPGDVVQQFMSLATDLHPVAAALAALAMEPDRPMGRRLEAGRRALPALLAHGDIDQANALLLMLLDQAMKGVGRREMIEMVRQRGELLQLREADDLMFFEAQLHLADGATGVATGLLTQLAQQQLAADTPWDRAEAATVIEMLEGLPEADAMAGPLRARLDRAENSLEEPAPPPPTRTIRLLIVGGNEMQARYEVPIRDILKVQAPHVIPTFITTGWGGNWGQAARDVIRLLKSHDGMVLHYYIRTMFGRKVREATGGKPWRSVAGHGRDGIVRGIYACAEAVLQQGSGAKQGESPP